MHLRSGIFWMAACICAAQPATKVPPKASAAPHQGVKTPGVQIAFTDLKPEAEFAIAPRWLMFTDAPVTADDRGLYKIDAKKNELGAAVASVRKPCGGAVSGFTSLWVPACG